MSTVINHLFTLSAVFFLVVKGFSQNPICTTGKNVVSIEGWGVSSPRSINFERVLYVDKKGHFLSSIGLGYYDNFQQSKFRLIPLRLFTAVGTKGFWGEFGLNYVFQYSSQKSAIGNTLERKERLLLFQYGFRYQRFKKRGLFIRGYIMPVNEYGGASTDIDPYIYHLTDRISHIPPEKKYLIWGGIGIGYHFGK